MVFQFMSNGLEGEKIFERKIIVWVSNKQAKSK